MMKTPPLNLFVFAVGLAAVCWIGAGYLGSNLPALAVTGLIGALYLAGARELAGYRRATASLVRAMDGLDDPPATLAEWLQPLHPSLREAVRLRVEDGRAALPAPALTPYLVGMLVLLGMLGTLLGMVLTLRGTGMALETATDLQAIRDSLAAPVRGLGVAFGTSIAGVAASAMLGLLSALCRRERVDMVQRLDAHIATTLRPHSRAQQREQALALLQQQAGAMPALVERLDAMMASLEHQAQAAQARQAEQQAAFHADTADAYRQLAGSLRESLQAAAADSARASGQALQPVVEATMAGLSEQGAALRETVSHAVQQQLQALSTGFAGAAAAMTTAWEQASVRQMETNRALTGDLQATLDRFGDTFAQRSSALLDSISEQLDASSTRTAAAWDEVLARQEHHHDALTASTRNTLAQAVAAFEQHAASLLQTLDGSHARLQAQLAEQDEARLSAWSQALASMGDSLRSDWQQAGADAALRQQAVCDALARAAQDISTHTQAHASQTIAEISTLVEAASEAPRAAAEVIAGMRRQLSDSMARDTALLDERARLMETLGTLLDAVNGAATEQRSAIDALVATSADLLDRVGSRFTERIDTQAEQLEQATTQLAAGAAQVAGLGEAFAGAAQRFDENSTGLAGRLEALQDALARSLERSDEQLAYYVAQAREVVDLSMLAQRQIIADLQRLPGTDSGSGAAAG